MKLKPSEAVFLAISLVCIAVGIAMSVMMRTADPNEMIDLSVPESADTVYNPDVLNSATADDFMEISGIGQVKASDIIAFRDAIGGFKRVEQLKEVNGISDVIYAKIIEHFYSDIEADPAVTVADEPDAENATISQETEPVPDSTALQASKATEKTEAVVTTSSFETEKVMREVDINTATAEEIADALMIDIELAERITDLREQIHHFSSVQEIYLVDGIGNATYQRIKDYIIIE